MKTKPAELFNLIEEGRANLENTSEFIKKVDEIKKEVTDKYSLTMVNEKNWVKRILIKIKLQIEIRKRVRELSSLKNLHIVNR